MINRHLGGQTPNCAALPAHSTCTAQVTEPRHTPDNAMTYVIMMTPMETPAYIKQKRHIRSKLPDAFSNHIRPRSQRAYINTRSSRQSQRTDFEAVREIVRQCVSPC